jgi:hypothetical protein
VRVGGGSRAFLGLEGPDTTSSPALYSKRVAPWGLSVAAWDGRAC